MKSNIKKTKEILQEESNRKHNNEYLIIGEYINSNSKIEIEHLICGKVFLQAPYKHIYNNKCPFCFGKNKITKEILQKRSIDKYGDEYTIIGEYVNNLTPILIKHNVCGNSNLQIPNNHLRRRCFSCYGTPKKNNQKFQLESDRIHSSEYSLIGEYLGANKKVKLLHKICGKEFSCISFLHLKGSKCSYCYNSKGENKISDFLNHNNIDFEKNKSFDGCKFKNKLRFDFYLEKYKICIEYDGVQHFDSIEWFGGEKSLIEYKIRDEIKNKWCLDNNINLIRISYKENIEDKLKDIVNIYNL